MLDNNFTTDFTDMRWRRARKAHCCTACDRTIQPGERYRKIVGKWDGYFGESRLCRVCAEIFDVLMDRAGPGDAVAFDLDCGQSWEDVFREPPPDDVAALAFALPLDWEPAA
jgi:hypothetical protein